MTYLVWWTPREVGHDRHWGNIPFEMNPQRFISSRSDRLPNQIFLIFNVPNRWLISLKISSYRYMAPTVWGGTICCARHVLTPWSSVCAFVIKVLVRIQAWGSFDEKYWQSFCKRLLMVPVQFRFLPSKYSWSRVNHRLPDLPYRDSDESMVGSNGKRFLWTSIVFTFLRKTARTSSAVARGMAER